MRKAGTLALLALFVAPAFAADEMTVAQLETVLAGLRGLPDKDFANRIGDFELTQRLTSAEFQQLELKMPGEKSREALLALADAAEFLDLPASKLLPKGAPDQASQGIIVSHAVKFVDEAIARMPDFFATKTTSRFEDVRVEKVKQNSVPFIKRSFILIDKSNVTVGYRNGMELVDGPEKKKATKKGAFSTGLSDRGVFGPLLGMVMTDMVKSTIRWKHWEKTAAGDLAVFEYSVRKDQSNFTISFCCVPTQQEASGIFEERFGYHGEITIEAMSGAVLRLVVETEPDQSLPISRADIAVDYGPIELGGKDYVCPRRSIAISTVSSQFYQPKKSLVGGSFDTFPGDTVTAINDVRFDSYHLFRADIRILPDVNLKQ